MNNPQDVSLRHVLPHSEDAERAVLGAILLRNECITAVVEYVNENDFFNETHRILFRTMVEIFEQDNKIDLVSLKERLRKNSELESVGGAPYLSALLDAVPTSANIEQHSKIVQEKSILRKLIKTADGLIQRGYDDSEEVDKLLGETESELLKLSERLLSRSALPISKVVGDTFKAIEKLYNRRELVSGLPTSFADLDTLTSGFHNSDLIIIAGRPAMGKTTFALNIAHQNAITYGTGVLIFSLEMAREQLVLRLLSAESMVDGIKLRNGFLHKEDWPRLTQALGRLSKAPIYIDDSPSLSPFQVRAKARRLCATQNVKLIVIDYLQLMQSDRRSDSRQQEIAEISRSMKAMAKELQVPVIALSQLSRAVENRDRKKRPQLSDLRESGAIEQDADLVIFLYRPEVYGIKTMELPDGREELSEGRAEIIVAKHRNGPTGSCHLAFLKQFMLFKNLGKRLEGPLEETKLITSEEDEFQL